MSSINANSTPMGTTQGNHDSKPKTLSEKIGEGAEKTEFRSSAYICRVPEKLRQLNENAYTPRLLPIGPLHSTDKYLKSPIQDIKLSYVNSFFGRMTDGMKVLKECEEKMAAEIEKAKKCYAEEVEALDAGMLVIDGCFILELLYRYYDYCKAKDGKEKYAERNENSSQKLIIDKVRRDPIFGIPMTRITVRQDLLLLENQLPFFVLEKLFKLTVGHIPDPHPHLSCYIHLFLKNTTSFGKAHSNNSKPAKCRWPCDCVSNSAGKCWKTSHYKKEVDYSFGDPTKLRRPDEFCVINLEGEGRETSKKSDEEVNYHHLLHLLHSHYLRRGSNSKQGPPKKGDRSKFMYSASDLEYSGVKFVPGTGEDLFKVNFTRAPFPLRWFSRARFEIPNLGLHESTELFLRNLIAFEQCCPAVTRHFTSYASFMDRLVTTEKDVEVLEKARVIRNSLGSSEAACDLFNNLCKHVVSGKPYSPETLELVAQYRDSCWPAAMAYVRRKYFANPWTFIAFCVALIAFGISVTQFIRSFLP